MDRSVVKGRWVLVGDEGSKAATKLKTFRWTSEENGNWSENWTMVIMA